jgi:hypothetical protein
MPTPEGPINRDVRVARLILFNKPFGVLCGKE